MMGFRPVARHRSREVLLYRQGDMNVIVNAHASARPSRLQPTETPVIAAIALRVRDAAAAYRRALDRGAWAVPTQVEVMELQHPGDPWRGHQPHLLRRPLPRSSRSTTSTSCRSPRSTRGRRPSPGLHLFGIVQYIGNDRTDDWTEFYRELFGFDELPDEQRFGILPKGRILQSPCEQLLPAADRARTRHASMWRTTNACSASAWARPTCRPTVAALRAARRGVRRVRRRAHRMRAAR